MSAHENARCCALPAAVVDGDDEADANDSEDGPARYQSDACVRGTQHKEPRQQKKSVFCITTRSRQANRAPLPAYKSGCTRACHARGVDRRRRSPAAVAAWRRLSTRRPVAASHTGASRNGGRRRRGRRRAPQKPRGNNHRQRRPCDGARDETLERRRGAEHAVRRRPAGQTRAHLNSERRRDLRCTRTRRGEREISPGSAHSRSRAWRISEKREREEEAGSSAA